MSPLASGLIMIAAFTVPFIAATLVLEHRRCKRRDVYQFVQSHPFIPETLKEASRDYKAQRTQRG